MAGIAGSHAGSLANPIPGVDDLNTINKQEANMTPLEAPVEPMQSPQLTATPAPEIDPLQALSQEYSATSPSSDDPLAALAAQYSAPAEDNEPAPFYDRFRAGFASNEQEKAGYLRKLYGPENVTETSEGIKFKDASGKWKKFNADHFGVGDAANLGRQAVVEAGALPVELSSAAAAAGEVSTIGGAVAAIPTLAAGRFVGGAMGEGVAQSVAHDFIGIPRQEASVMDAFTNDLIAQGEQGGIRAILGHASDAAVKGIFNLSNKAVRKEFGKAAADAVEEFSAPLRARTETLVEESKKPWTSIGKEMRLRAHIQDALDLEKAAQEVDIPLLPRELMPNDNAAKLVEQAANKSPKMQEWRMQRAELVNNLVEQFQQTVAKGDAKQAPVALKSVSKLDRELGPRIGGWRKKAVAESGDQLVNVKGAGADPGELNYADNFKEAASILGFIDKDTGHTKWSIRDGHDVEALAEHLSMKPEQVKWIHKFMQEQNRDLYNKDGMFQLKEVDRLRELLSIKADDMYDNQNNLRPGFSKSYQAAILTLQKGARDSFTTGLGHTLGEADKAAYNADKARFGIVKDALADLSKLFNKETTSPQYIAEYLTKSPADAPQRIAALKELFAHEHPDALDSIKAAYWNLLKANHSFGEADMGRKQLIGDIDMRKLLKTLNTDKAQYQTFESMFGVEQAKSFRNLVRVSAAMQGEGAGRASAISSNSMLARLWSAGHSLIKGNFDEAADIVSSSKAAATLINEADRNKFINNIAVGERPLALRFFSAVADKAEKLTRLAPKLAGQQSKTGVENVVHDINNDVQGQSPSY